MYFCVVGDQTDEESVSSRSSSKSRLLESGSDIEDIELSDLDIEEETTPFGTKPWQFEPRGLAKVVPAPPVAEGQQFDERRLEKRVDKINWCRCKQM